jgi:parallel beta-helix repeat protein
MGFWNRFCARRMCKRAVGALTVAVALAAAGAGAGAPSAASTPAATPVVSSACPQTVSGSVRLETDLLCTNSTGLIVGADNTVIDLNGHKIVCTGSGYQASCQGESVEIGVDTNGYDGVHVFSHADGGTIDGFDRGVFVRGLSDGATVKQLTVTGPALSAPPPYRPAVFGVLVEGNHCADGTVLIGGNEVENHTTGIRVNVASCVNVSSNSVHDNSGGDPDVTLNTGIRIRNSSENVIRGNVVTHNGSGVIAPPPPDSGISLDNALTTDNQVVGNEVTSNNGEGIATAEGASGNSITNNEMRFNTQFDAYSANNGSNSWNRNNRCRTQTSPDPPAGVCNPGE